MRIDRFTPELLFCLLAYL